ncbi:hypothetical protein GJ496_011329 [Pomphorhynchus laevis]|nr:hypothetical protein GJ496_011329 [Pomphorhynchus laevis]
MTAELESFICSEFETCTLAANKPKVDVAIELGYVTQHNIKQLQTINSVVFPIIYNPSFYQDVLNEHSALSRLAYCNDLVVGAVCGRIENTESCRRLYIMTLGVLESYRHLGIGSKLLDFVMKTALDDKTISGVYLHVQTSNEQAINFYKKSGFELSGVLENYYRNLDTTSAYLVVKLFPDRLSKPSSKYMQSIEEQTQNSQSGLPVVKTHKFSHKAKRKH